MRGLIFKKLYKTSSTGKELEWGIHVQERQDGVCEIITIHGQVGGKLQQDCTEITEGKNIGKSNETSIFDQACSEAQSKWNKQLDKKYSENRGGASKINSPMLAKNYDDRKDKVVFPAYIQPKLDGVRCIAIRTDTDIKLYSRMGKEFPGLTHIKNELKFAMGINDVFDGELYSHDITFQETISLVKKDQPDSIKIKYHIYDCVAEGSFYSRSLRFVDDFGQNIFDVFKYLVGVHTETVSSHEAVRTIQAKFIAEGYEGAMLRVGECLYKEGSRSSDLLKVKDWMDAEFKIVNVVAGEGRMANQGVFICDVGDGNTFKVRAEGADEEREEFLANKASYIGKLLTVKFFEMSTSDVPMPRFPVGLRVREDGM